MRQILFALMMVTCATNAVAQNACELARQTVLADHNAYKSSFDDGKAFATTHAQDSDICAPEIAKNLDSDIAALDKEIRDAGILKETCPGVERAQTGADKLIASLEPRLASAHKARDAVSKACPAQ